ncbi:MAG: hypothetical protein RR540_04840 [Oscillospiraceae bacterium]
MAEIIDNVIAAYQRADCVRYVCAKFEIQAKNGKFVPNSFKTDIVYYLFLC